MNPRIEKINQEIQKHQARIQRSQERIKELELQRSGSFHPYDAGRACRTAALHEKQRSSQL